MGIAERRKKEKALRRTQILNAARKVFSEKGYDNATMRSIASESEFSTGTLYLHFRNKDELYTALSIDMLEHMSLEISNAIRQKQISLEEKLNLLKSAFLDMYDYDAKILIHLFYLQSTDEQNRLPSDIISRIKNISSKMMQSIALIFQDGMDQGQLKDEHPNALADIVWGLFSGLTLWGESKRQVNSEKDFVKETLETAFSVFFSGLQPERGV